MWRHERSHQYGICDSELSRVSVAMVTAIDAHALANTHLALFVRLLQLRRLRDTASCARLARKTVRLSVCSSSTRATRRASRARSASCGRTTAAEGKMTGRPSRRRARSSKRLPAAAAAAAATTTTAARSTDTATTRRRTGSPAVAAAARPVGAVQSRRVAVV